VTRVSTATYGADKDLAPRPVHSTLRLDKISAAGFRPEAAAPALERYLAAPG
jgi:dTDP-4-dehydrorhamnose 3,5-epimerase